MEVQVITRTRREGGAKPDLPSNPLDQVGGGISSNVTGPGPGEMRIGFRAPEAA